MRTLTACTLLVLGLLLVSVCAHDHEDDDDDAEAWGRRGPSKRCRAAKDVFDACVDNTCKVLHSNAKCLKRCESKSHIDLYCNDARKAGATSAVLAVCVAALAALPRLR